MSQIIDDNVKNQVKQRFEAMKSPVQLIVYNRNPNGCNFSEEMKELVEIVAGLSSKIDYKLIEEPLETLKGKYHLDECPAIEIRMKERSYGIRFYGVPAGKEFTSFIESIMLVSLQNPHLSQKTINELEDLSKSVNLKVFVTLQCPYCPRMVLLGHQFALASDNISADMVEATQFVELSSKYNIYGVPNTIINNGEGNVEGLVNEQVLLQKIKQIIGSK
jgi:glutaredoxin-like protein